MIAGSAAVRVAGSRPPAAEQQAGNDVQMQQQSLARTMRCDETAAEEGIHGHRQPCPVLDGSPSIAASLPGAEALLFLFGLWRLARDA